MKFHGVNVVSLSIRLRGLPGRSSKGYRGVRLHCITPGQVRLCCATPGQASFAETSFGPVRNGVKLIGLPGRSSAETREVRLLFDTPGQASFAETSFRRSLVEHRRVELLTSCMP
jgi:hypothetical protein